LDTDELFAMAEEAQDVLEQTLTEEDRDTIKEVYRDISRQVKWGQVIDNAYPVLLEMVEELITSDGMSKEGGPWFEVAQTDQHLFDDKEQKAMARQHSLLLLLGKKLLGALKTRVNQSMGDIRVLSQDEEIELEAIVEEAATAARETDDSQYDDLLEEENRVAKHEVVAEVSIAPEGDCRQNGRHIRTTIRWKRKNEEMFQETYCKDCRQVVERLAARKPATPKQCEHPGAEWIDGEEGKKAVCTACKEPIENPDTYHWVDAGLEPFGDDPSEDEVITLCSDY